MPFIPWSLLQDEHVLFLNPWYKKISNNIGIDQFKIWDGGIIWRDVKRMAEGATMEGMKSKDYFLISFFFQFFFSLLFYLFLFFFCRPLLCMKLGWPNTRFISWHCGGSTVNHQLLSPLECRWMMYDFSGYFFFTPFSVMNVHIDWPFQVAQSAWTLAIYTTFFFPPMADSVCISWGYVFYNYLHITIMK